MRRAPELTWGVLLVVLATALYLTAARSGSPAASGLVGHGLGVLGALIMLAGTFGYSWRKRPGRVGPGSMAQWLRAHVVAGLVGPYLVLLHTGFVYRGLAGVTFGLMVGVVLSGVVGRFVYAAVPKLDLARLRRERQALLREAEPLEPAYATSAAAPPSPALAAVATARLIERRALASVAGEKERMLAAAERAAGARRLLAGWWLLHVPLALAVFALALMHALAALYYATLLR